MSPEFREFVTHPRYGQGPRFTGLNPENDNATGRVFLHWHSPQGVRIPNTAIPADVSRQVPATIPVTHYFDAKRRCADCGRAFLFFAAEQKYWYEELFHVPERTPEENLEMAGCVLSLVEAGVFGRRQIEHVRSTLRKVPSNSKLQALCERVHALEGGGKRLAP